MTATQSIDLTAMNPMRVHRVEVHPKPGQPDPHAGHYLAGARQSFGHALTLRTARVYLIEAPLSDEQLQRVADELLADPINQQPRLGASPVPDNGRVVEVHYKPGVMDPVAQSTQEAILEMLPELSREQVQVRTGYRYELLGTQAGDDALRQYAQTHLANTVIEDIHAAAFHPARFEHGHAYTMRLLHVPMRDLDDAGLMKLSRQGHLFLSLEEMQAVQAYYRDAGREPTDIELETLAQTWSEHCVHKTLKATIRYHEDSPGMSLPTAKTAQELTQRPGHTINDDGSVTIHNLLKSTVAAATHKLMLEDHFKHWCVSVFVDNAGIVRFDETDGVCIKVETHNHPSAIEPYGGAATGIGGCIRDVMGTGLAARPIANTNVFAVAFPQRDAESSSASPQTPDPRPQTLPKGVIHPRRILERVVAGVRDYGNRMGIPTVNGAVLFHEGYLGNPLVFAGCVGLIPLDKCFGDAKPGDRIIALGGSTGRDGIHGATFSSAELTDTHADEFSHAVQIGNAITQKKTMDVILQARDAENGPLFSAITDCGAGGFSSAVGEMGGRIGARVTLETAPLKYAGLSYTEIWISEAQERMVLAVPSQNIEKLQALCAAEDVQMCDLGEFGVSDDKNEPQLVLTYQGTQVGQLSMHLLHDGIPTPTRQAQWKPETQLRSGAASNFAPRTSQFELDVLHALLSHPNIASKHWIIRQYDHEVQGGSVVKPLVGVEQDGPSDGAVVRPKLTSNRGISIACGLQPQLADANLAADADAYWMALAAVDEAVRNSVCVGADPDHIAILDNFCWPRCDDPKQLGSLVRAAEACYDAALAYRTPFVSGKDSLNNQFTTEDGRVITIQPTLLITALGIVPEVLRARTMDAKAAGNALLLVGLTDSAMGGSHYRMIAGAAGNDRIPRVDLQRGPAVARAVASLIAQQLVASAHDCSDGGLLVAAAEMAFAGRLGLSIDLGNVPTAGELDEITACFAETPSRYLLEVSPEHLDAVVRSLREAKIAFGQIGLFDTSGHLTVRSPRRGQLMDACLTKLRESWLKTLDW